MARSSEDTSIAMARFWLSRKVGKYFGTMMSHQAPAANGVIPVALRQIASRWIRWEPRSMKTEVSAAVDSAKIPLGFTAIQPTKAAVLRWVTGGCEATRGVRVF